MSLSDFLTDDRGNVPTRSNTRNTTWINPPAADAKLLQEAESGTNLLQDVVTKFIQASAQNPPKNPYLAFLEVQPRDEFDFKFDFEYQLEGKGEGKLGRKTNSTDQEVGLLCLFCKDKGQFRDNLEAWNMCSNCKALTTT